MAAITEHSITLNLALPEKTVHKKMEVFYNPVMASHRNISILLLNSLPNTKMNIADPLAGSGIRSLRFMKELKKGKINQLFVNDMKEHFPQNFNESVQSNKIKTNQVSLFNEEASLFLVNRVNDKIKPTNFCGYFDYIDIDPFGSPNPFLDPAIARICRSGILAITATDTAALTGTYEKVTKRKYWAQPLRNYLMHEIGLRILIRKIQLQGIQFEKALTPILSYSKDHYYRLYLQSNRGKVKCDELVKQHQYFLFCHNCLNFKTSIYNHERCSCGKEFVFAGPLWIGNLGNASLLQKMAKNNPFPEEKKLLDLLQVEYHNNKVGFYDLHVLSKKYKTEPPKMEPMLKILPGSRTHFTPTGIKTDKKVKDVLRVMKYV